MKTISKITFLGTLFFALCVLTSVAWAATYYVDATNGNDSNPGISESAPWKTIAKVNASSFQPGDNILLKRGDVWREQLIVPSSGYSGDPITFSVYGSGEKPIINGAKVITGWTVHAGNIYRVSSSGGWKYTNSIWEDNTVLTQVSTLPDLTSAGKYFVDSGNSLIYLWSTDNADPDTHTIEAGDRVSCISVISKDYIKIHNLTLEKGRGITHSILTGDNVTYLIASNLTIKRSANQAYGIKFADGNNNTFEDLELFDISNTGIYIHQNETNAIIRRCLIHDVGNTSLAGDRGGITIGAIVGNADNALIEYNELYNIGSTSSPTNQPIVIDSSDGAIVRYNKLHDNIKGGICVSGEGDAGDHIDGVEVYYNLIYDNNLEDVSQSGYGAGITLFNVDGGRVYNNVIWNYFCSNWLTPGIFIGGTSGQTLDDTIVKNNIIGPFLGSTYRRHIIFRDTATFTNFTSDYNLFYDSDGLILLDSGNTYNSLSTYKTATGFDNNSIESDPLFTNASNNNFTYQSTSPAIDGGTDVGLSYDYRGTPVPQYGEVDVGVFEYYKLSPPINSPPINFRIVFP
jgi:hypothetical protein